MPNSLPSKKYLSISETANFLSVSIDTIRRWDKNGTLTSERLDGKNRYFDLEQLKLLKDNRPLSISEAATKLGVSVTTLRRLDNRGLVTPIRNAHGERMYTQESIDAFLKHRGNRTKSISTQPISEAVVATVSEESTSLSQTNLSEETSAEPVLSASAIEEQIEVRPLAMSDPEAPEITSPAPADSSPKEEVEVSASHFSLPVLSFFKGQNHEFQAPKLDLSSHSNTPAHLFPHKKAFAFGGVIAVLLLIGGVGVVFNNAKYKSQALTPKLEYAQAQVLAETTKALTGNIAFNIPAFFNEPVTFRENIEVNGTSLFTEDVTIQNQDLTLGTGAFTAGSETIAGLSTLGTLTVNGASTLTGVVTVSNILNLGNLAADPATAVNGATYYNTTSNVFRCYVNGAWANCDTNTPGGSMSSFNISNGSTSFTISNGNTFTLEAGSNVSIATDTSNQKLTISASAPSPGMTSFTLAGDGGTSQTIENGSTLTIAGSNGITTTAGATDQVSIALDVDTTGTTSTTASNSGLELTASGLRLLGGCSNTQILKWSSVTSEWGCANDSGGSTAIINVQEGGVQVGTNVDTLNFNGTDFSLNESPSGRDNINIDYASSGITRSGQNETISGNWTFSSATPITFSNTAPTIAITDTTTLNISDGTNNLLSLTDAGSTGDLDISGTLSAGTGNAFSVSQAGGITIASGQTLTIGTIGLNAAGASNTASGAYLIGVFDEFTNSDSTILQEVLKDFDDSIGAGSSKWTINTTPPTNVLYPTGSDSPSGFDIALGGTDSDNAAFFFDVSTSTAFFGINESVDGKITLYSSGGSITDPTLVSDAAGNLIITSTNLNTTSTGINNTVIGATTPAAATFSTLTASGTVTFSNLAANQFVKTTTGGELTVSQFVDLTTEVTGTLPVGNGGTGAISLTGILIGNGTGAFTATTTSAGIAGQISDETGSGSLVFATSPTLVTPTLGVASATSINGLSLTSNADGFSLAGGTTSRTLTVTGTNVTLDQNLSTSSAVTFATVNTGQGANELYAMDQNVRTSDSPNFAALSLGVANTTTGLFNLFNANHGFYTRFQTSDTQGADVTYTLPDDDGSNNFVLTTDGTGVLAWQSVGGIGGLSGSGTTNTISKFTSASTIGDSALTDNGTTLAYSGTGGLSLAGVGADVTFANGESINNDTDGIIGIVGNIDVSGSLTVGTGNAFTVNTTGAITAATGITSSGTITFSGFSTDGGVLYTNGSGVVAQSEQGTLGQCLKSNAGGAPTFEDCASGGTITAVGDVVTGDAFTAAGTQGTSLWFYDVDGRGQLTIADLTAARTYTLPDASGEVTVLGNTTTGSGAIVLATSPTLVTPILGVATATSINGISLTANADGFSLSGGTTPRTLTVTEANKTLSGTGTAIDFDGNLTFAAAFTTANAMTFGAGTTGTITLGDSNHTLDLTTTGATAITLPTTGTLATLAGVETFTNKTFASDINFLDADATSYTIAGADASTATGNAGNLTVRAGAGGATSGNGGNLILAGGTETSGTPGYVAFQTDAVERFRIQNDGTFLFEKGTNDLTLSVTAPSGASRTATIPALTADDEFCFVALGNCAGSGGGITGAGTANTIAKFTGAGTIGDSLLTDDATDLIYTGAGGFTVGDASTTTGLITLYNDNQAFFSRFQTSDSQGANITYTLPIDDGDNEYVLATDGNGLLSWQNVTALGAGTITAVGDVTTGDAFTSSGTQGTSLWFYDADGRGQLTIANLTAARTYTLPDTSGTFTLLGNTTTGSGSIVLATSPTLVTPDIGAATGTSLTLSGDLAVNGGDITSTATTFNFDIGNTGTLNFRDGTNTLASLVDGGTTGSFNVATINLGTASTTNGQFNIFDSAHGFFTRFQTSDSQGANITYTLPIDDGDNDYVLTTDGSGVLAWQSVGGAGGISGSGTTNTIPKFTSASAIGDSLLTDNGTTLTYAGTGGLTLSGANAPITFVNGETIDNNTNGTITLTGIANTTEYFSIDGNRMLSNFGTRNIFVGEGAGNLTLTSTDSTILGYQAGDSLTNGSGNVFLGTQTGSTNDTGGFNTFIGFQAGNANTSASNNVFVGAGAGLLNETGTTNVFIGNDAGRTNVTGQMNTFVGQDAGRVNTASFNTFLGRQAGLANTSGAGNTFLGIGAGIANTTAGNNVFVGADAGNANTEGTENVFLGRDAGGSTTDGDSNTFLGDQAGNTNTTGSYNIYIGDGTEGGTSTASSIGIGFNTTVTASNQLVIGSDDTNGSITDAYFGQGVTKASPAGITLNATGGSGSNNAGAALTLAGGKGTGNAAGGSLIFQTSDAGSSGSTLQSLTTKMIITAAGNVGIGDTSPAALLTVGTSDAFQVNSSGAITGITLNTGQGANELYAMDQNVRTTDDVVFDTLGLGAASSATGTLTLYNSGHAFSTVFQTSGSQGANITYTLPVDDGTDNYVLTTNGSGVLAWESISGAGAISGSGTTNTISKFTSASTIGDSSLTDNGTTLTYSGTGGLTLSGASAPLTFANGETIDNITNGTITITGIANTSEYYSIDGTRMLHNTGTRNIFVGEGAGNLTLTATDATAIGYNAGTALASGSFGNTFVGASAGAATTTTSGNTYLGNGAGDANDGNFNTFLGRGAGGSATAVSNSVFIGHEAGFNTNVNGLFIGYNAGYTLTTGTQNTIIGGGAGSFHNASGNVLIGEQAGRGVGNFNVVIGRDAVNNTSSTTDRSVIIGDEAGFNLADGDDNIFIGENAGNTITSGDYNIFLGGSTDGAATATSSIGIGYNTTITANNQLVIGSDDSNGSITDAYFGQGVTDSTPAGITLNATGGSGADNAGAALTLAGGKGTGNAAGGSLIFQTSNAGSSGSTLQSLSTKMIILASGNVGIGDTSPTALFTVGSSDAFQINSSGAIAAVTGYTQASGSFNVTPDGTNDVNITVANASGRFLNIAGLASGTSANSLCQDASGNVITCTGGGSGTVTGTGTDNFIPRWDAAGTGIEDSLLSDASNLLTYSGTSGLTLSGSGADLVFANGESINNDSNGTIGIVGNVSGDGSLLISGTSATTPTSGAGTRLMWVPNLAALRAGIVSGTQWDSGNIGNRSIALGDNVIASSTNSIAIGDTLDVSGVNAIAFGFNNTVASTVGTAIGNSNSIGSGGSNAFVGGAQSSSDGDESFAFGNFVNADADNAIAIGNQIDSDGVDSFTLGKWLTASGANSFVIGEGSSNGSRLVNSTASSLMIGFDSTSPTLTVRGLATTGSPNLFTVTGQAHTTLTADTEASDLVFNLNRTVQFSQGGGTFTNQRAINISAPTYSFTSGDTITNAATLYINGAPTAGTNATITNAYAFWVDAGTTRLDGEVQTPHLTINTDGDVTSSFTTLDGSNQANGIGSSSTTLTLDSTTNFTAGNYISLSSTSCSTGVNTCYAKIVSVDSGTQLTISPPLTWADNSAIVEVHVPEIGATNTASTLINRYGRGYFIDGVVAGNGSTYYTDNSIIIEDDATFAFKNLSGDTIFQIEDTGGGSVDLANLNTLQFETGTNDLTIAATEPTGGSRTATIPALTGNDEFCFVSLGNCAGSGSGITGSGSANSIAKFTSGSAIGNSLLTDNATTLSYTGTGGLALGTASTTTGVVTFYNDTNAFFTRFQTSDSQGADVTYTLPVDDGTDNYVLTTNGSGVLAWESVGGIGSLTGSGTTNTISKFTGTSSVGDSLLTDNGTTLTYTGTGGLDLAGSGANLTLSNDETIDNDTNGQIRINGAAPTASATTASLLIGPTAISGGDADGTFLGVNSASTFTGDFMNLQQGNVSLFKFRPSGSTTANGIDFISGAAGQAPQIASLGTDMGIYLLGNGTGTTVITNTGAGTIDIGPNWGGQGQTINIGDSVANTITLENNADIAVTPGDDFNLTVDNAGSGFFNISGLASGTAANALCQDSSGNVITCTLSTGTIDGSGTANAIPKFTDANTIGDSLLTDNATTLGYSGTGGLSLSGTGADIVFTNGESINNDTDGTIGIVGDLDVSGHGAFGNNAGISTTTVLNANETSNDDTNALVAIGGVISYTGTSNANGSGYRGLSGLGFNNGNGTLANLAGLSGQVGFNSGSTTGTITTARALWAVQPSFVGTGTITNAVGLGVNNQGTTGVTNAYGIAVSAQSGASTLNIGASLGGGTTANLWLNSDTASMAGGIAFGTARDVNLYRSAANVLRTDDAFNVNNTFNVSTAGAVTGATGITSSGTITFSGFSANGGVVYANGSGVLAQTAAGTGTQCLLGGATPTFGDCGAGGGIDGSGTANTISKFTDANTIADSLLTDDGTTLTYSGTGGLDLSGVGANLTLSNDETIDNDTDGIVRITASTTSLTGNLGVAGTTGLTFSGAGADIVFTNGESINNDTDGTIGVAGNLDVSGSGAIGNNASVGSTTNLSVGNAITDTASTLYRGTYSHITLNPAADSASSTRAIEGAAMWGGTVNSTGSLTGIVGETLLSAGSAGTVTSATGILAYPVFGDTTTATVTTARGINVMNSTLGGGTITNQYGLIIQDQTSGTNDYGLAIAGADTQALWISSGADNTDAANGIAFGISRDTNLYRSAASVLRTDDAFNVNGTLNISTAGAVTGATGITSSGTITFSGFSANGGVVYANGSGVLTQTAAGTGTQCLLGGATPSFGDCGAGGGIDGSGTTNFIPKFSDSNTITDSLLSDASSTLTYSGTGGLDLSGTGANLTLSNDETIDNDTDGTVRITASTTSLTGNLGVAGTTGLTFSGVGADIVFTNGESINNDTDGTIGIAGNIDVTGKGAIGNNASINSTYTLAVNEIITDTAANLYRGTSNYLTFNPAADSAASLRGLETGISYTGSVNSTGSLTGLISSVTLSGSAGTVGTAYSMFSYPIFGSSTTTAVTTAYGLYVTDSIPGGGTITNQYGIRIIDMTAGTNDYGIRIDGADTAALWLASDSGAAADGISFGTSRDVTLYRSAANVLRTDDAFNVNGTFNVSTAGAVTGATGITSSGTITFSGFSANGGVVYTNGSGVLAQTAAGTSTQCLLGGATPTFGDCSSGGGLSGSGTTNTISKFTGASSLGDSLLTDNATTLAYSGTGGLSLSGSGAPIDLTDNSWVGLASNTGRIEFDDQTTDEVNILDALVGIGTSTPTSKFQIGNGTVTQQWSSTTVPYVYIQGVDNETAVSSLLVQDENLNTMFELATTGDMTAGRAYFGGNVGIGTATPLELVQLSSTGTSTTLGQLNTNLRLQTLTTTANAGSEISFMGITGGAATEAMLTYAAISAPVTGNNATTGTIGYLSFSTKAAAADTSLTERMRINTDGNVGIGGDTTPNSLFSVGSTSQFQVNSSGAIVAATGITSSGTITFSGFSANGGVVYANGSGVLAQTAAGTSTQCLLGGATPTFGDCSSGGGVSGSGTSGQIAFFDGANSITSETSGFGWDSTNNALSLTTAVTTGTTTASAAYMNFNTVTSGSGLYITATGLTTGKAVDVAGTNSDTAAAARLLADFVLTASPGSASSTGFAGIRGVGTTAAGDNIDNSVTGVLGEARNTSTSGTVSLLRGVTGSIVSSGAGGTVTNAYSLSATNASVGAGTITNNYGLFITDQTGGTNDYGIAIAGADTQALWISSGADNTDAANGIAFGSSRDTNLYRAGTAFLRTSSEFNVSKSAGTDLAYSINVAGDTQRRFVITGNTINWGDGASSTDVNLYRSAANVLRTDDAFNVNGTFNVSTAGAVTGATGITSSGTITFSGFSANGGVVYTNGSGVLAQTAAGTSTQCLLGGATPTFGDCSSGGGLSGSGTTNTISKFTGASSLGDSLLTDNATTLAYSGTGGLDLSGAGANLTLSNDETIDNDVDGTIAITAATTTTSGNLSVAGTTGISLTGTGGDLTFANNESISNDTNGTLNLRVDGTSALNVGSTGISSIGNVAHTIVNASGALNIDSATTGAINIGTGANAKTITVGNATGATALNFNSGTGAQTFTSLATTGTAFSFVENALTTGNGLNISTTNTGLTSGKLLNVSSTANFTAFTGSFANIDWSPASSTTATGDLLTLNVGANGTLGNLFNIKDSGSSVFAVSESQFTTSLPVNFTSPGDVSMAYNLGFTNSTSSQITSQAPLAIQAGQVGNSSNLTLGTYNEGSIVFNTANTTTTAVDITNSTVTTGKILNISGSAITSGNVLSLAQSNGSGTGAVLGIANSGTGADIALSNTSAKFDIGAGGSLAFRDGTNTLMTLTDSGTTGTLSVADAQLTGLSSGSGNALCIDGSNNVVTCTVGAGGISGSGTANTIPKFATASSIGDSLLTDNATTLTYSGTGGLDLSGVGANLTLSNDETIDNDVNGTIAITAPTTSLSGILNVAGNTDLAGTLAVGTADAFTVSAAGAIVGATLDTGQGANELYDMNQNVMTTSTVSFAHATVSGAGAGVSIGDRDLSGSYQWYNNLDILRLHNGTTDVLTVDTSGNLALDGALTTTTVDTGQGANELYDMNQNVQTTDSPSFTNMALTGTTGLTFSGVGADLIFTNGERINNDSDGVIGFTDGTNTLASITDNGTTGTISVANLTLSGLASNSGTQLCINGTTVVTCSSASAGITGSGAGNRVTYWNGTSTVTSSANFTFDPAATTGTSLAVAGTAITTGDAVAITANAMTTGSVLDLTSTSTAGTGSNNSVVLNVARSGTNTNSLHIAYGINSAVTNTGTNSTNIAGAFSASGATTNYSVYIDGPTASANHYAIYSSAAAQSYMAGNLGLGDTSPAALLTVGNGDLFQVNSSGAIAAARGYTQTAGSFNVTPDSTNDVNITVANASGRFLNIAGLASGTSANALCQDASGNVITCTSGGANTALSNLASVAINESLTPGVADSIDLGSTTAEWDALYVGDGDGIFFGINQDTNLFRGAANRLQTNDEFFISRSAASDDTLMTAVSGDTFARHLVEADGSLYWGPGNAGLDTKLYRTATTTLSTEGQFFINNAGANNVVGLRLDQLDTDQIAFDLNASNTTANVLDIAANALTSGNGFNLSSTSTALTTGNFMNIDWSPGSATTATGDLLRLNVGANGTIGNFFNILNNGSSVFSVSQTQMTSSLPVNFTAAGDVSIAYDINFTNPTASYITSQAPLYIAAGEPFNSSNLVLNTYNSGQVVLGNSTYAGCGKLSTDSSGAIQCSTDGNVLVKASDQAATQSSTTFQNDNTLQFTATANKTYVIEGIIHLDDSNTSADAKYTFVVPSGTINIQTERNASATTDTLCNITSSGQTCTITAGNSAGSIIGFRGYVAVGGTGGTVAFQFAQNSSQAVSFPVSKKGSILRYTPVAGADLAEYYNTNDSTIEPGHVVTIDPSLKVGVKKSESSYDKNVLGIISTEPGVALADKDNIGDGRPVPVALAGRVPVKVSTENGPIAVGDWLTSSSTPGVAMKATKPGQTIGKAMQNYSGSSEGLIIVFVNLTSADPSGNLANLKFDENGNLLATSTSTNGLSLNTEGQLMQNGLAAPKLTIDQIDTAIVNGDTGTFANLFANSFDSNNQTVTNNLNAGTVITNHIQNKSNSINVSLENGFEVKSGSSSAAFSVNSNGEASASAKISAPQISANQAEIETLTVKNLIVENIITEGSSSALLDFQDNGVKAEFAEFEFLTVDLDLTVRGTTTLNEATVQNTLTIGSDLTIANNTINTLASDLEIQPLKQAAISLMADAVRIETDGTVTFRENVAFEKDVQVQGVLSANSIKGTLDDVKVASSAAVIEISDTEVEASGSAGLVTLKDGQLRVKVNNPKITKDSLIFITPKGSTGGNTLFIEQQVAGKSFTVKSEEGVVTQDINFNFLIVN